MYNLRYHIASLVAVFLALALGLVLGGIVVERGTLDAQRNALVSGLREDFRKLSTENKQLKRELAVHSQFSLAAATDASRDRLKGKRIIIVSNAGRPEAQQAARRAVEQAGGTVALVQVIQPGLGVSSDVVKEQLSSQSGSATPLESASVVASLAAEWTTGAGSRPVTDALAKAKALRLEGLDPGATGDGVVIVASADGKPDDALLQLGESFERLSLPAVGAETLKLETGVAAASANLGMGAVGAVDTPAGAWSLVELLAGGSTAFYGDAGDADAPFAPLPQFQPVGPAAAP